VLGGVELADSWHILKWLGIAVVASYSVLMLVTAWRFRTKLSRLRGEVYWPMILGNFIWLDVPSVFENVVITRVCFVVAHTMFVGGIVILLRGIARQNQERLLKADGAPEQIQSLKLS
jgi:hypothetical protein